MKSAGPEFAAATAVSAEDYGTYGADYRFSAVEETIDGGLLRLIACWNEIRGARAMPTRAELNPFVLRASLRFTQLFDILDGGRDFRFRVFGSGIAEVSGLQVTGKCLSELEHDQMRTRIVASLCRVMETRAPARMTAEHCALEHLAHRQLETVWLPLGDDTGITQVLSGVIFRTPTSAAA